MAVITPGKEIAISCPKCKLRGPLNFKLEKRCSIECINEKFFRPSEIKNDVIVCTKCGAILEIT
jgi:hypothetical protein